MAIKNPAFIFLLLLCSLSCVAQDSIISPEQYIEKYKDLAISEMKRTGIPASITLAQGMFESGNGNSFLAKPPYNNHFGIKCKSNWTGRSVKMDDDELQECFRAYDNAEDSYKDHSNFLTCEARYAFLFRLKPTDYKDWAYGLKKAGYATNPKYPSKLIDRIEQYQLYQYDIGNKRVPPPAIAEKPSQQIRIALKPKPIENSFFFRDIPAYVIKPNDNYETIADQHDMMRWEIRKYNDLNKGEDLKPGTVIYLKPKRRKGKQDMHLVKEGEGMYYVSQIEAIKLRMLYKWNRMEKGDEPAPGEQLYLRHKRKTPPVLLSKTQTVPRHGIMLVPEPATGPKPNFDNKCPVPIDSSILKKIPADTEPIETDSPTTLKNIPIPVKGDSAFRFLPENNSLANMDGHDSIGKYHIAQPGETIYGISKDYGVPYKKVIAWNQENTDIKAGQKIYITQPKMDIEPQNDIETDSPQIAPSATPSDTGATVQKYTVKPGDTLYSISKRFNVPISKLIEWNGLTGNAISVGEELKLGM